MFAAKTIWHHTGDAVQRFLVFGTLLALNAVAGAAEPLGSTKFISSPKDPIGWRGDGTGRYPGATPPTSWERITNGNGYATKGIAWMAPLPNSSAAPPILVGDK